MTMIQRIPNISTPSEHCAEDASCLREAESFPLATPPSRHRDKLARLGIYTKLDLLFHLPLRYQDRTRLVPIGAVRPGDVVCIEGVIEHNQLICKKKSMLIVRLSDGTGCLDLKFFHFTPAQQQSLHRGIKLRCFGEVRGGGFHCEMVHPEYRFLGHQSVEIESTLTPVYPATEGLHQKALLALTEDALEHLDALEELLPESILTRYALPTLQDALRTVHRPDREEAINALNEGTHPAQRRLAFEELMAHHLSMMKLRYQTKQKQAHCIQVEGSLFSRFLRSLDFSPTTAQYRVIGEILKDISQPYPMLRLVQGDVGCGKTLVAIAACLYAVEAGLQAAVMVPTEILAEQHYQNFQGSLQPLGIKVAWLSGKLATKKRRETLEGLISHTTQILVGTHALFQDEVEFARLGLIVIDEQHRFGVNQRMALREKGSDEGCLPHQLIMTATPIPRTLSMTAYADLDHSIIDELPPGRRVVKTVAINEVRKQEIIERISKVCAAGAQAYWVCTLVEESEVLQCQAAEQNYVQLSEMLPHLRLGLVHGRMKSNEKELVMQAFKAGDINLLVATTVIEVGVDVPNASLMIIENAERLGLSQLHQLRGRVGRGSKESACVLLYRTPLTDIARTRLNAMRNTQDGFVIAKIDLDLRGPGELLGTRQTGSIQFRIADILRDQAMLEDVKQAASLLWQQHPECIDPLIRRWLAKAEMYGEVA